MKKLISIRNALLPISAMVLFFTAVCTGIGILAFGSLFSTRYANDIAVFSPDSRYTLIIRPRYDWDGAGADFYCRATGNPAESLIGGVSWQDHYHPFRDGQYRIHWEENSVTVFYAGYSASDVSSAWKSVKFPLPNQENAGFPSPQNTHFFLDFFHVLCYHKHSEPRSSDAARTLCPPLYLNRRAQTGHSRSARFFRLLL